MTGNKKEWNKTERKKYKIKTNRVSEGFQNMWHANEH